MADRESQDKNGDLEARLAAVEALIQQTILRVASVADPNFGDIIEGTADQMAGAIGRRMNQAPEVLEHVERILAPVRKEAEAYRARQTIRKIYRGFDD